MKHGTAMIIFWFKRDPILTLTLGVLGVLCACEIAYGVQKRRAAYRSEHRWMKKLQEWNALCAVFPPATRVAAAAIETDLDRVDQKFLALRDELNARGAASGALGEMPPSLTSTDIFFDLAALAERMRTEANQKGVKTRMDERFGFSAYARQGPESELIPVVFRQCRVMQYLAEALIEARPDRLLGLQREDPLRLTETGKPGATAIPRPRAGQATTPSAAGPYASDLFVIDSRVSARVPRQVTTMAFRLTFIAQTATLRAFLNKIAGSDLPMLVRALEVEPVAPLDGSALADNRRLPRPDSLALSVDTGDEPRSVVPRVLSKFSVTIEYFEYVDKEGNAAPVPAT